MVYDRDLSKGMDILPRFGTEKMDGLFRKVKTNPCISGVDKPKQMWFNGFVYNLHNKFAENSKICGLT